MTNQIPGPTPVEVVARLYQLFGTGRLDDTFTLMDPDVTLVEPGDPAVLPWAGEFRGHSGLRRFYEGLAAGLSHISIDADTLQVMPIDDQRVLVLGTERGTASSTARTYTTQSAWIWTVQDGAITHLVAYHDTAAMVDAMKI